MKILLPLISLIFIANISLACEPNYKCDLMTECNTSAQKMTYAAFIDWVNTHEWTPHDVVAFNSSYVLVEISDACITRYSCYDSQGKCDE